jgi:hypothetical protein
MEPNPLTALQKNVMNGPGENFGSIVDLLGRVDVLSAS